MNILTPEEIIEWVKANALYINPKNKMWQAKLKEWEAQLAKAQDEISFKAGYQQRQNDTVIEKTRQPNWGSWLTPLLEEVKLAGQKAQDNFTKDIILRTRAQAFREAVEWISKYRSESIREFICFTLFKEAWLAKLEEWGITEEK